MTEKRTTVDYICGRIPLTSVLPATAQDGFCPFCHRRHLMTDTTRGLWHCSWCQEEGDVITATMKLEGVTFREAIERLGALAEAKETTP